VNNFQKYLSIFVSTLLLVCFVATASAIAESPGEEGNVSAQSVAEVKIGTHGIGWVPRVEYRSMVLSVSVPDGTVFRKSFKSGDSLYLDMSDNSGNFPDGVYTYELLVIPPTDKKKRSGADKDDGILPEKSLAQTGYFSVRGGKFVTDTATAEGIARPQDVLHYDDVIITGSLCVGFDCADGESFGFDTIILKEHNLRIYFNDTSYTASYPTNSWRITINDSTNGGASYFSVDDVDDGTSIFKIEAGAPSNSLYVEDYGRVGLGTSTPVVELHIKDSDTPTVRLEQDSSGGWTAQTFDVAGNESNFFIRDTTNGSRLPFRIQPDTPSSTLCLKAAAGSDPYRVGIGTWSPGYPLEIETTGANAAIVCDRTDGAQNFMSSTSGYGQFGTVSNHPTRVLVNSSWKMQLNSDNSLSMASGATCTAGGTWTNTSSRALKENIQSLGTEEALNTLSNLNPVKFNYKIDKTEKHVGFIAEDAPELVATKDRKGMSPMDVAAVLTKVVQEQQKSIKEQQEAIRKQQETVRKQEKNISELKKEIDELKKKSG